MRILGGLLINPKIVLAGGDQPLVPENLLDVPDRTAVE